MGEIGSGTGSSYPAALDTDNTPEVNSPAAGKTKARAEVPNDLAACIVAIETELGTDPAGTLTNVKTFLQTEHNTDGTHDNTKVAMLAGTQTITGNKTLSGTNTISGATTFQTGGLTLDGTVWPSFSAYKSGTQAITTATDTKVTFDSESFDTNSDFATSRFTPTVAGKYLFTAQIYTSNIAGVYEVNIYKNGAAEINTEVKGAGAGVAYTTPPVIAILDANGTTDYFEIYVYHSEGADRTILSGSNRTFFHGSRIA